MKEHIAVNLGHRLRLGRARAEHIDALKVHAELALHHVKRTDFADRSLAIPADH